MKYLQSIIIFSVILFASISLKSQGLEPDLLSPSDDSKCEGLTVDFIWTQMPNAIDYDLQVTTVSGSYTNPEVSINDITTTTEEAVLSSNNTTYYWRVRANYSSTFAWSEEFSFTTRREGTTTVLPAEGEDCKLNPIYFEWNELANVSSYHLQVSSNQSFNSPEVNDMAINSNTFQASLNQSFTDYYWRVRANYASGTTTCVTDWSNSSSFKTAVYPPELNDPTDNSIGLGFSVNFRWTPNSGSASYTFQLSDDENFTNIIEEEIDYDNDQVLLSLPEEYNKEYFWRVKAKSINSCESDWSQTFSFRTKYGDVTLDTPLNEATCIPVEEAIFTWVPEETVETYRIQISENPEFSIPILFNLNNVASTSYTAELPTSLKKYYWRVRAEDGNNVGDWSEVRELTSGLFSPDLVLPVNDSTETFIQTSFTWQSQNAISNYNFQLSSTPGFEEENLISDEKNLIDENIDVTLPDYGATYYWRVSASYTECSSNWSEVRNFTTMTGVPNLMTPEDEIEATPLTILFTWSNVKYNETYDLEISTSSNFDVIEKGRLGIDTSIILISDLKPETKYYWRVRTNTSVSKAPYSEVRSFTTGVEPTIRPFLLMPKDKSVEQPTDVLFGWTKVSDADYYQFELSEESNFTEILESNGNIADTTFIVSDLENYKTYYWRVRSGNSAGVSAWTVPWRFRTIAPLVSDSPVLSSPIDGAVEINHRKTELEWFAVENTIDVDGAYHLQISTSEDFADGTVEIDTRSVFENKKSYDILNHTTEYFWRVRGFNEAGDGPWSEVWSFSTYDWSSVKSDEINELSVYPNPANQDVVKLNFNLLKSGATSIKVFDINGNRVINLSPRTLSQGIQSINLDVSKLSNGTYYILIDNEGEKASINLNVTK